MLDIHVQDDGVGFKKSHRDGFGLSGMRERIHELNGSIKIKSEVHQGVSLDIQLPLKRIPK